MRLSFIFWGGESGSGSVPKRKPRSKRVSRRHLSCNGTHNLWALRRISACSFSANFGECIRQKARIPSVLAGSHPTVRVDPTEHGSLCDWPIYPHGYTPFRADAWLPRQRYLYTSRAGTVRDELSGARRFQLLRLGWQGIRHDSRHDAVENARACAVLRRTDRTQEAQEHSHGGPIGRKNRRNILTADQSDARSARACRVFASSRIHSPARHRNHPGNPPQ
eukprot:395349-Prorocentrum_minimum.AAC.1